MILSLYDGELLWFVFGFWGFLEMGYYWCYSKKWKYLYVVVMWYFYIKRLYLLIVSIIGNREKVFVCDYFLKKSIY